MSENSSASAWRGNLWLCATVSRGFVIRDSVVCTGRCAISQDGSIRDTLIHIRLLGANCLRRITYNFTHASTSSCRAYAAMFGLLMGTSICSMISMSRTHGCSLSARTFDIYYSTQISLLTWSIIWRSRLIGMYGESIVVMMTIHPPIRQIIHPPTHPSTHQARANQPTTQLLVQFLVDKPCRKEFVMKDGRHFILVTKYSPRLPQGL